MLDLKPCWLPSYSFGFSFPVFLTFCIHHNKKIKDIYKKRITGFSVFSCCNLRIPSRAYFMVNVNKYKINLCMFILIVLILIKHFIV